MQKIIVYILACLTLSQVNAQVSQEDRDRFENKDDLNARAKLWSDGTYPEYKSKGYEDYQGGSLISNGEAAIKFYKSDTGVDSIQIGEDRFKALKWSDNSDFTLSYIQTPALSSKQIGSNNFTGVYLDKENMYHVKYEGGIGNSYSNIIILRYWGPKAKTKKAANVINEFQKSVRNVIGPELSDIGLKIKVEGYQKEKMIRDKYCDLNSGKLSKIAITDLHIPENFGTHTTTTFLPYKIEFTRPDGYISTIHDCKKYDVMDSRFDYVREHFNAYSNGEPIDPFRGFPERFVDEDQVELVVEFKHDKSLRDTVVIKCNYQMDIFVDLNAYATRMDCYTCGLDASDYQIEVKRGTDVLNGRPYNMVRITKLEEGNEPEIRYEFKIDEEYDLRVSARGGNAESKLNPFNQEFGGDGGNGGNILLIKDPNVEKFSFSKDLDPGGYISGYYGPSDDPYATKAKPGKEGTFKELVKPVKF